MPKMKLHGIHGGELPVTTGTLPSSLGEKEGQRPSWMCLSEIKSEAEAHRDRLM